MYNTYIQINMCMYIMHILVGKCRKTWKDKRNEMIHTSAYGFSWFPSISIKWVIRVRSRFKQIIISMIRIKLKRRRRNVAVSTNRVILASTLIILILRFLDVCSYLISLLRFLGKIFPYSCSGRCSVSTLYSFQLLLIRYRYDQLNI